MPSKSRSPFWNRLSAQKLTGAVSLMAFPPTITVLVPCGRQAPSAYSHSWPLAKLLLGQAIGPVVPSVDALRHTPVFGLHPPSPLSFLPPSLPPTQVSETLLSTMMPGSLIGSLWVRELQTSACPISCCISTPPSSAAQGTWFCGFAVAYSAWKVCGVPAQVTGLGFMNPLAALAVMKPVWWVVMSVTDVVKPVDGSVIATFSTSPALSMSVCALGVKVAPSVSCGLGGPAGTPLVCRKAKLSGCSA